ncbi:MULTISPECIES: hypothetical protein [Mesorhizobium]|uniref:hypothetical protein n=1 Tax=Mesorhizobium TaxID=68287 RepID=UPI00296231CB|nr:MULTISPECIES: hypothetical protein [unclassified Mesorhizobium]
MLEHGQALDWPKYSDGAYAKQQTKAKASKTGLWVGTLLPPWDWRAQHGDDAQAPPAPLLRLATATPAAISKATYQQTAAHLSRAWTEVLQRHQNHRSQRRKMVLFRSGGHDSGLAAIEALIGLRKHIPFV